MLDLVQMSAEADSLAVEARNARCCDALRPCHRCTALRRNVIARRLVIRFPRRQLRVVRPLRAASGCLTERLAS